MTPPKVMAGFGGETFVPAFDAERLTGQYKRVWDVMKDGRWMTLAEIKAAVIFNFDHHDSEAAISARLRDFRKKRFGGHRVERRRRGSAKNGLFEYSLIVQ